MLVSPDDVAVACDLEVIPDDCGDDSKSWSRLDILDRAAMCVCGEREEDYGSPEDSFGLIAEFWTSYLKRKCVGVGADVCVGAADVAMLMALLKIARVAGGRGTADCFVDLAGYAACGGEVARAEQSRGDGKETRP